MFRVFASTSLATLVIGAAALAGASVALPSSASAWDGRYERGHERPVYGHAFRPAPPVFHGYWGQRRWRRHHEAHGYGFRAPPPAYSYGYGWR